MVFSKKQRKEFQLKIFQDQLERCWNDFHEMAQRWLKGAKLLAEQNVSAETIKTHPNQIMTELKKINYQRTYLEFKIKTIKKDRKLPLPTELHQKMLKAELSVHFQREFPSEYNQFTAELKNKLATKPYRPVQKYTKSKPNQNINIPWKLTLDDKPIKKLKKLTPSVSTMLRAIHGHGKSFRNHEGYFQPPTFTKARVEKTFNVYLPHSNFQNLKKRLNSIEQRKKLGGAKKIKKWRKGNNSYIIITFDV